MMDGRGTYAYGSGWLSVCGDQRALRADPLRTGTIADATSLSQLASRDAKQIGLDVPLRGSGRGDQSALARANSDGIAGYVMVCDLQCRTTIALEQSIRHGLKTSTDHLERCISQHHSTARPVNFSL
jgi:hypothetical protein